MSTATPEAAADLAGALLQADPQDPDARAMAQRQAAPQLRTRTGPVDVAKVIAFLCDPTESGCMTGATLVINSNL